MGLKSVNGGWVIDGLYIPISKSRIFILTHPSYWAEREEELKDWCEKNNCVLKGMTVEALDDHAYLMFNLKWTKQLTA